MNIEELFLSFSPSDESFPNGKDYISSYKVLKGKFDTLIHPEIKSKILEIEKEGYYNDHGVDHIKMVIDRASRLIEILNPDFTNPKEQYYISPYEIFILLLAINLHDSGHLISSRSEHARKGKELLARFDEGNILDTSERLIIGEIAKVHGGKNDPIGSLQQSQSISHKKIRPQFLAAILRLADELAEDKTRASQLLLKLKDQEKKNEKNPPIEPTSEIYHRYSASLDGIDLDGKQIGLNFYVYENQLVNKYKKKTSSGTIEQFLIDEIYERAVKTFTEALYCNWYFPPELRFTKVKVKINLLSEYDEHLQSPIEFILKEIGYPTLMSTDIFVLCKDQLIDSNGIKINGEYLSQLISKTNEKSI